MGPDEIICRFVTKYNQSQSAQYQITRWPDKENSQSRDCDAYAEASNVLPLAIEHTNVLTFYNQKRDSAYWEAVIKKNSLLQQGIETLRKQGR